MWKPVNIILKLYSENAYISYFFKLANINRFLETTLHTHGCANPSRTFFFDRIYQVTSRPPFFTAVVHPAHHLRSVPISLANTSTVYVRATAQLLFLFNDFSQKVLWKALQGRPPYRLQRQKLLLKRGSPQWEASSLLSLFFHRQTFHASEWSAA